MKKLFTIIICCAIAFSFGYSAIGAITPGTMVTTYSSATGKPVIREIIYTCVASGTAFTATAMTAADTALVKGWALDEVEIDGDTGGVEVTEDSDLRLLRDYNVTPSDFDVLGGNGVDQVDNTESRTIVPSGGGQNKWIYITSPLTISISGNLVATNPTCYIRLRFVNPSGY